MNMNMLVATCLLLTVASMARAQLVALPPDLAFSCSDRLSGFYADPLYECQVFHICVEGQKHGSMLCPVGTAFSQSLFTCTWAVDADCVNAQQNYIQNGRLYFQDEDPAVREAIQSRNAIEQISSAEHPGKSLDHIQPVFEDPTQSLGRSEGLVAQDGGRKLFEQPPKFVNNFDDSGNDIDVPTSSEEPIYVPSVVFTLPVGEQGDNEENELLRVAENVQHIGEILLPKEGRSLISRDSLRPTDEYLPPVTDNFAQDSIPSINDYLPPVQDDIPPTNDYLPPVQDDISPTNDYLPPVQDDIPPTNDYLPPVQDDIPPTNDYLPPVQDDIPPTNDYLPPVQDDIPPTNDYLPPVQNDVPPTNEYLPPNEQ